MRLRRLGTVDLSHATGANARLVGALRQLRSRFKPQVRPDAEFGNSCNK
jgi:hypothetical protein